MQILARSRPFPEIPKNRPVIGTVIMNTGANILGPESTATDFVAGYPIGAVWIKENEPVAVVLPKINGIDYLKMFSAALTT